MAKYKHLCESHEKYCKRVEFIDLRRDVICSLLGRIEELERKVEEMDKIEYQLQCEDHDIVECGRIKDQGLKCAMPIETIHVPKPITIAVRIVVKQ